MINVILCDESEEFIDECGRRIKYIAKKYHMEVSLIVFTSGEELMFHMDSYVLPDIICMETMLGNINGIEVAKQLRERGCVAEIIFITMYPDYVFESFDVSPTNYLLKDSSYRNKFEEVFLKAAMLKSNKNNELFVCEAGHSSKVIPIKEIAYFEIWKRKVDIHYGDNQTFQFYETMEQLENELKNKNFARTHRSYLVNMDYIVKFHSNNVTLKTGVTIPVGVTYAKEMKDKFMNYIVKKNVKN